MIPLTPSSITSGTAPCRVAITGVPQAIDSIMTRPNGSSQSIGHSLARAFWSTSTFSPWLPWPGEQEGRIDEPAERDRRRGGMVVDHVEVAGAVEARERVPELRQRLADLLARRILEHVVELRLRARVAGGEDRHVVPGVDEPVREQRDHPLDPAVAAGRNREPDGAENSNPHASSTVTCASSTRTSHWRSKARTPVRRTERPTHDGSSGGASVSSAWRARSGRRPSSTWRSNAGVPAAQARRRARVG